MDKKARFRSSSEWKKLRKKIINRDKHCLICGSCDCLEVHHITPLDIAWNLRNNEENVITLCKYHHTLVHNGIFSQYYLLKLVKEVNDMIGQKFGKLTVLEELPERYKDGSKQYKCICECGNYTNVVGYSLRKGNTKSCGCLNHEPHTIIHGKYKTRLYKIWQGIKRRCYNKRFKHYKNYGDRGIVVCDEWKNDFMAFYNWSMSNGYKDNLTIDRINVNGNYEPNNCRWVTRKVQQNNTRRNVLITYNGKTQNMRQWADELGIKQNTICCRHRKGWSDKECLFGRSKIK